MLDCRRRCYRRSLGGSGRCCWCGVCVADDDCLHADAQQGVEVAIFELVGWTIIYFNEVSGSWSW